MEGAKKKKLQTSIFFIINASSFYKSQYPTIRTIFAIHPVSRKRTMVHKKIM
jgi:hypothetical protein